MNGADLFQHLVGRARSVQAAEELDRLALGLGVRVQLRERLGHLAVEFVALDVLQPARRKPVVVLDRIEQRRHVPLGKVFGLLGVVGHQHVEQPDRRTRRDAAGLRGGDVALIVGRGILPTPLRDDEHPEAHLRHDLGRFRADRRGVEPRLRVGDGPRADLDVGNPVILAFVGETVLRQPAADDVRTLDEPLARLVHRDPKTGILDRGRAAAEAEDRPPAGHQVEQRDLLRDLDRVVPGQDDDRGAELDLLGPPGHVRQQLAGVGRHDVAGEVVIQAPQRIEPIGFRLVRNRQFLPIRLQVRLPVEAGQLHDGADLHGVLLLFSFLLVWP